MLLAEIVENIIVVGFKMLLNLNDVEKQALDMLDPQARAYYSSGSRPKTSAHAWAMGRVKSFVTGKGGARKADKDLMRKS